MTTKRTHGPCKCSGAVPASMHLASCPSLHPAQQEPDALTRLERLLRMGPESGSIAHRDVFSTKALSLISEAREEHREALVRARNEAFEKAALGLWANEPPGRIAAIIRAMKEPES